MTSLTDPIERKDGVWFMPIASSLISLFLSFTPFLPEDEGRTILITNAKKIFTCLAG